MSTASTLPDSLLEDLPAMYYVLLLSVNFHWSVEQRCPRYPNYDAK